LEGLRIILATPIEVEGAVVDPLVSFGVDLQQGVSRAERVGPAIWCAEDAGDGRAPKFFDPGQRAQAQWELSLLGELDRGLVSGDVWVAFQPKVDLATGEWSGFEALARWNHPERGPVSPGEFIKLAERNDRLDRLTLFVLNEAVSSVAAMQRVGIALPVSVNVSTRSVKGSALFDMVSNVLARHNVAAEYLILEITETEAAEEPKELLGGLHQISTLGVGVSIDDFGSGNAGMEYLRSFPAREVKIDKEFVSGLEHSARDALFVESIVNLAHSMGRKVVAEGIENEGVYQIVKSLGCDTGQGFYLSEPLTFAEVVQRWRGAEARLSA
jgi:diguanylate cyclase